TVVRCATLATEQESRTDGCMVGTGWTPRWAIMRTRTFPDSRTAYWFPWLAGDLSRSDTNRPWHRGSRARDRRASRMGRAGMDAPLPGDPVEAVRQQPPEIRMPPHVGMVSRGDHANFPSS